MSKLLKILIVICIFICLALDFASFIIVEKTLDNISETMYLHQTVLEKHKEQIDDLILDNRELAKLWFQVSSITIANQLKLNLIKKEQETNSDEPTDKN